MGGERGEEVLFRETRDAKRCTEGSVTLVIRVDQGVGGGEEGVMKGGNGGEG